MVHLKIRKKYFKIVHNCIGLKAITWTRTLLSPLSTAVITSSPNVTKKQTSGLFNPAVRDKCITTQTETQGTQTLLLTNKLTGADRQHLRWGQNGCNSMFRMCGGSRHLNHLCVSFTLLKCFNDGYDMFLTQTLEQTFIDLKHTRRSVVCILWRECKIYTPEGKGRGVSG